MPPKLFNVPMGRRQYRLFDVPVPIEMDTIVKPIHKNDKITYFDPSNGKKKGEFEMTMESVVAVRFFLLMPSVVVTNTIQTRFLSARRNITTNGRDMILLFQDTNPAKNIETKNKALDALFQHLWWKRRQ
eukprot:177426_1